MTIAEYIRKIFLTCPCLNDMPISMDYLSDTPKEAALEANAVPQCVKAYTDGSKMMKYQFVLSLRLPWFNGDESEGVSVIEKICSWVEAESENGLPPMTEVGNALTPLSITPYPSRYNVDGKNSSARYQAIFELYYLKTK